MKTIEFETAIAEFLSLGRRLQAMDPLTAEIVLGELTRWYRSTRIAGAELEDDADMVLLQWGKTRPLDVGEPSDLREPSRGNLVRPAEREFKYLDFTRQIFAAGENDDAEFDDLAVQMCITLCYGPADGKEQGSNLWICTPDDIDRDTTEFRAVPFVTPFLHAPAKRAVIFVERCG